MQIKRQNPCQPGSATHRIVGVLMNSRKRSLLATEIAFRVKINTQTVKQVVSALRNKYHNCAVAKVGLAVKQANDGGFFVDPLSSEAPCASSAAENGARKQGGCCLMIPTCKPFPLGRIVATNGAIVAFQETGKPLRTSSEGTNAVIGATLAPTIGNEMILP